MRRAYGYIAAMVVLLILSGGALSVWRARPPAIGAYTDAGRLPAVHPDHAGAVIPPNIAPLNFVVDEPGTYHTVRIHGDKGDEIEAVAKDARIQIPVRQWQSLLQANQGGEVQFDVYARDGGRWTRFAPISVTVAREPIDRYLAYRLIRLTNLYRQMKLIQRDLSSFDESVILDNASFEGKCFNCHTFLNNRPEPMLLQVRETKGPWPVGMLVGRDGRLVNVDVRTGRQRRPGAYTSWHPSGRSLAFSTNEFSMYTHSSGFLREVYDAGSVLGVYLLDTKRVTTTPGISTSDHSETFPCWSPDGRYLYFCRTLTRPLEEYKEVRYDLMRIGYDAQSDTWGEVETVLSSAERGLSITLPRISPDGRFLVCCMSQFGNFTIYQPSSDLYLLDLQKDECRPLTAVNSDRCESWHCWSSNSRWLVFSSKRIDGLFSRPYLTYIDESGQAHKPVLLPQEDPGLYDSLLKTYNIPELIAEPIPFTERQLVDAIYSQETAVKATLDPRVVERAPASAPAVEPAGGYRYP